MNAQKLGTLAGAEQAGPVFFKKLAPLPSNGANMGEVLAKHSHQPSPIYRFSTPHDAMEFLRELFTLIPAPFNMVVAIVAIVFGVGLITELVKQARIFADNEADRRLKRDMIESGLSTDEAERIASMKITKDYKPKKDADQVA